MSGIRNRRLHELKLTGPDSKCSTWHKNRSKFWIYQFSHLHKKAPAFRPGLLDLGLTSLTGFALFAVAHGFDATGLFLGFGVGSLGRGGCCHIGAAGVAVG